MYYYDVMSTDVVTSSHPINIFSGEGANHDGEVVVSLLRTGKFL